MIDRIGVQRATLTGVSPWSIAWGPECEVVPVGTDHPSRANVVDASDEPLAPRPRLVVPRHPGSLLRLDAVATADELDQLIDEVFGPTTDERPGVFDAVLLVGGIALGAWGWLTNATGWVVVGVALM